MTGESDLGARSSEAVTVARLALIARTLQIAPEVWRRTVADFAAQVPPPVPGETLDGELLRCLPVLARAFRRLSPHVAPVPPALQAATGACPACETGVVRPLLARRAASGNADVIVYGRCQRCGHGALLSGDHDGDVAAPYRQSAYYQVRDGAGVGYDDYAAEASYREAKGQALVARVRAHAASVAPAETVATLLEVGSGFGFTRLAAERAGIRTAGVDLNPYAVEACRARTGLHTFPGDLAGALAGPEPYAAAGTFDVVLYQFVLEHVADPIAELQLAHRTLRPGGWLVLLVPSMEAAEVDVFGSSYRSFRADHLHLMTRASLAAIAARAGFEPPRVDSHCNLHLLRGCVSEAALQHLYGTGRGPDLFVIMRSPE